MRHCAVSVAVASALCFASHAEDIAPHPFPVTGCYVPEVTTCCKALDIDGRFAIRCAGVPETCYPGVESTTNVNFWQEAVEPGLQSRGVLRRAEHRPLHVPPSGLRHDESHADVRLSRRRGSMDV